MSRAFFKFSGRGEQILHTAPCRQRLRSMLSQCCRGAAGWAGLHRAVRTAVLQPRGLLTAPRATVPVALPASVHASASWDGGMVVPRYRAGGSRPLARPFSGGQPPPYLCQRPPPVSFAASLGHPLLIYLPPALNWDSAAAWLTHPAPPLLPALSGTSYPPISAASAASDDAKEQLEKLREANPELYAK